MTWQYGWLETLGKGSRLFWGNRSARGSFLDYLQVVLMERVCWNPRNSYEGFANDSFLVEVKLNPANNGIWRVRADALSPYQESIMQAVKQMRLANEYFDLFYKGRQADAMRLINSDSVTPASERRGSDNGRGSSAIRLPQRAVRYDLFLGEVTQDEQEPQGKDVPIASGHEYVNFAEVENDKQESDPIPF